MTGARHLMRRISCQMVRRLAVRTVYAGRFFKVTRERWRFGAMPPVTREIIHHSGSVVVVPLLDRYRLVLIRQYRVAARRVLWELPAGTREGGESLRRCALRELREETGYRARYLRHLARFWPSPGVSDETMDLFAASGLAAGSRCPADDEPISTCVVDCLEASRMVRDGLIIDAKTIVGVLLVHQFRDDLFR